MKLICITGIDGTGKSTLARNTVASLNEAGTPAKYIYGRTYPVLSRALMWLGRRAMLRKSEKDVWADYVGYSATKKQTMRNPILKFAYTASILTDYYVQIWLKLLPYLFSSTVIISDRYVYDTVISDLAVHLNYTQDEALRAVARGLKFVPRPTRVVLIDVPEEVAFSRKDDVPHIAYLEERRAFYQLLVERPEVMRVDGEHSPTTMRDILLENLEPRTTRPAAPKNLRLQTADTTQTEVTR